MSVSELDQRERTWAALLGLPASHLLARVIAEVTPSRYQLAEMVQHTPKTAAAPVRTHRRCETGPQTTAKRERDPMTITMPDRSDHRTVTERLNRTVHDAPGRPCADPGADPEQWFPREPGSGRRTRARANYEAIARQLCHGCPVQPACLELSIWLEGPDRGHGISGGTAPWQRQAIKANRGMAVRRD